MTKCEEPKSMDNELEGSQLIFHPRHMEQFLAKLKFLLVNMPSIGILPVVATHSPQGKQRSLWFSTGPD